MPSGIIKAVSWRNPPGQILLTAKDDKGVETVWGGRSLAKPLNSHHEIRNECSYFLQSLA